MLLFVSFRDGSGTNIISDGTLAITVTFAKRFHSTPRRVRPQRVVAVGLVTPVVPHDGCLHRGNQKPRAVRPEP